jgi:hypothetical protein
VSNTFFWKDLKIGQVFWFNVRIILPRNLEVKPYLEIVVEVKLNGGSITHKTTIEEINNLLNNEVFVKKIKWE